MRVVVLRSVATAIDFDTYEIRKNYFFMMAFVFPRLLYSVLD